jgi:parallel beta-helix repeat protein
MSIQRKARGWACVLAAALVGGLASVAQAVDGVILINQASALAGNVTPGDTPGFPVTISRPGSYRLTSNLTVLSGPAAIVITVDNVTLDLNGFGIAEVCLVAPGGTCPPGRTGIASDHANVTVVNGTVRGMGGSGVSLGPNARVERVRALNNRSRGIEVGAGSMLSGNTAHGNGQEGISTGAGSTAIGNTAHNNGATGIIVRERSMVIGNAAHHNGFNGINALDGSTAIGNTTTFNARVGLGLSPKTNATDNVASDNGTGSIAPLPVSGENLCDGVVC